MRYLRVEEKAADMMTGQIRKRRRETGRRRRSRMK